MVVTLTTISFSPSASVTNRHIIVDTNIVAVEQGHEARQRDVRTRRDRDPHRIEGYFRGVGVGHADERLV